MIHTDQIDQAWQQGLVTIRPLRSLTEQALEVVRDAIRRVPGDWTFERHDDYDGYLSVLIAREGDLDGPTFLISGQVGHIELATLQDEELHTLGRFEDIEATAAELVSVLNASAVK